MLTVADMRCGHRMAHTSAGTRPRQTRIASRASRRRCEAGSSHKLSRRLCRSCALSRKCCVAVVHCRVEWCGAVWIGVVWCGAARHRVVVLGGVVGWVGVVWCGVVCRRHDVDRIGDQQISPTWCQSVRRSTQCWCAVMAIAIAAR